MGDLVDLATWRERRLREQSAQRVDDLCQLAVSEGHGSNVTITSSTIPVEVVAVASYDEQMKLDPTPENPKP